MERKSAKERSRRGKTSGKNSNKEKEKSGTLRNSKEKDK